MSEGWFLLAIRHLVGETRGPAAKHRARHDIWRHPRQSPDSSHDTVTARLVFVEHAAAKTARGCSRRISGVSRDVVYDFGQFVLAQSVSQSDREVDLQFVCGAQGDQGPRRPGHIGFAAVLDDNGGDDQASLRHPSNVTPSPMRMS